MGIAFGHCIVFNALETSDRLSCSCGWSVTIERGLHPLVLRNKLDRAARRHLVSIPIAPAAPRRPLAIDGTRRRYRTF